ncbi:hypothetical protein AXF42_Ash017573 [Apostasia shenzhenica]|uniref:Uncharacterized protein n=1 Tax=Apostasia shenzhenica TaxID=1088818 RepID=A0A2I0A3A7_9ASPA|nr:hypothetical protein AXF42_Ash017573 [Apostasia shenzhenica]
MAIAAAAAAIPPKEDMRTAALLPEGTGGEAPGAPDEGGKAMPDGVVSGGGAGGPETGGTTGGFADGEGADLGEKTGDRAGAADGTVAGDLAGAGVRAVGGAAFGGDVVGAPPGACAAIATARMQIVRENRATRYIFACRRRRSDGERGRIY